MAPVKVVDYSHAKKVEGLLTTVLKNKGYTPFLLCKDMIERNDRAAGSRTRRFDIFKLEFLEVNWTVAAIERCNDHVVCDFFV